MQMKSKVFEVVTVNSELSKEIIFKQLKITLIDYV